MTREVWKFPVLPSMSASLNVVDAVSAKPIAIGEQSGEFVMWVEVVPLERASVTVKYAIVGTGWPVPADMEHMNTIQLSINGTVWHAYRETGS